MKTKLGFLLAAALLSTQIAASASISGDYLEVRSCDIYTGACVANSEMGLSGNEGMMVWSVRDGSWNGVTLDGLTVIAVIRANGSLGDLRYEPRRSDAVLVVDAKATSLQREALQAFARSMAGDLIEKVVQVKFMPMEVAMAACNKTGCASVKAGSLVEISTRCLGGNDHLCGNEELYYPPLSEATGIRPAMAELAAFRGNALNVNWQTVERRSVYLVRFSR